ncbi:hypothetical protein [Marivita sp.]|uniref:hypothetical protein n=1 Tax=Marivita sp. TaxID=2003365 RepID=UPI003F6D85D1
MSRKFIAVVLAVSTTIAAFSAAPARAASEDDIAKLLAGAATVFIIGKAIQSSRDNDRKEKSKTITHYKPHHQSGQKPKSSVKVHQKPIPKVVPRDVRPRHRDVLPSQCVRRIQGGHVNRVVMSRCLSRNNISARSLPKACRMKVETRRGATHAYALPCLRHRGYTLARR